MSLPPTMRDSEDTLVTSTIPSEDLPTFEEATSGARRQSVDLERASSQGPQRRSWRYPTSLFSAYSQSDKDSAVVPVQEPPQKAEGKEKPEVKPRSKAASVCFNLLFCSVFVVPTVLFLVFRILFISPVVADRNWHHGYDSPISVSNLPFADPVLLHFDNKWYAFGMHEAPDELRLRRSTAGLNHSHAGIQSAVSLDSGVLWNVSSFADQPVPHLGAWVEPNTAPSTSDVVRRKVDGRFVLYYAATLASTPVNDQAWSPRRQCIGAAISEPNMPTGPFRAMDRPMICGSSQGGATDPSHFIDHDGSMFLVYSIDDTNNARNGSCADTRQPVMIQQLQPDGVTKIGNPMQIFDRSSSRGLSISRPSIVGIRNNVYFLFFSSGCGDDSSYEIRYATAPANAGVYIEVPMPLLRSGDWGVDAPGSPRIHKGGIGGHTMVFHAQTTSKTGKETRSMFSTGVHLAWRSARLMNAVDAWVLKKEALHLV